MQLFEPKVQGDRKALVASADAKFPFLLLMKYIISLVIFIYSHQQSPIIIRRSLNPDREIIPIRKNQIQFRVPHCRVAVDRQIGSPVSAVRPAFDDLNLRQLNQYIVQRTGHLAGTAYPSFVLPSVSTPACLYPLLGRYGPMILLASNVSPGCSTLEIYPHPVLIL